MVVTWSLSWEVIWKMKEIVALGDLVKSIKGFKRTVLFKHAFRSSSFLLIDADIYESRSGLEIRWLFLKAAGALELKGCLVYGWAVSKKLPTSFLICCSKAFYDGAWLNIASVGSWAIRFVWWRSFPHNAWRVEWNFRSSSACPCQSPSSASAWSAAKGPYPFWSSFFHRQGRGPCQRWSTPLARANIEIFFSDERA